MSAALVAHATAVTASPPSGAAVTSGVNTTGANLLIAVSSDFQAGFGSYTISDSKSNTWIHVGTFLSQSGQNQVSLWYVANPVVGAAHTLSIAGQYNSIFFAAFSGCATPAGQDGAATFRLLENTPTTMFPGAKVTLPESLIILVYSQDAGASPTVNSGMTFSDQKVYSGGTNEGGGLAYLLSASGASFQPTLSWGTIPTDICCAMQAWQVAPLPAADQVLPQLLPQ